MPRVLYVCHNHPMNRPGGAELYAHELYQAVHAQDRFEATLVTKVGPPFSAEAPHEGTRFARAGGDPDEYLIHTTATEFDRLLGTMPRKRLYAEEWRAFLQAISPDVVHFQHTLYLGYDLLRATRAALPDVPIVYTLHEFLPICHHSGQMVRRFENRELCDHASPRRCHECFPGVAPEQFFLRERFIKSAFTHVDTFITPSRHARERYIGWGLPETKVVHEDYGRIAASPLPDPPDAGRRGRIAFIGQLTPFKGVDVLLEAMKRLGERDVAVELMLHGGNLEHQTPAFQEEMGRLLEQTAANVRFHGTYAQSELPGLLSAVDWVVVPSIWWETGPLVIHEALMHHRPVICSDIGAMLERIEDGVNGLHFRVGDPDSLAARIAEAVQTPGLWEQMRSAMGNPHSMEQHLEAIYGIYERLLAGRAQAVGASAG
jgi:glycosyltransferase involved in cell wall biosynthesis